jgi:hypothetical protein
MLTVCGAKLPCSIAWWVLNYVLKIVEQGDHMGLERGSLSLVSTTEELLVRKVAAPGLERGSLSLASYLIEK